MPVRRSIKKFAFPAAANASKDGLLAVGGEVTPERLIEAYSQGIFPWPHEDHPLLWFTPDPRFVLPLEAARIPRSLRKTMRRGQFEIRADTAFGRVMAHCSRVPRPGQDGTWITDEMVDAYVGLHRMGMAHSIEAWQGDSLVGGLYGVSLGAMFCGESMFALAPDASKVAFATLLVQLQEWGFEFVDCQVRTDHLARFGAEDWIRTRFLKALRLAMKSETRLGPWELSVTPEMAAERLKVEGGDA